MGDKRKGYHPSKSYAGKATKIEQEKPKNLVRARQGALRRVLVSCWRRFVNEELVYPRCERAGHWENRAGWDEARRAGVGRGYLALHRRSGCYPVAMHAWLVKTLTTARGVCAEYDTCSGTLVVREERPFVSLSVWAHMYGQIGAVIRIRSPQLF